MAKTKGISDVKRKIFYYCRFRQEYIRPNRLKAHLNVCSGKHVETRILLSKVAYYVK